MARTAKISKAQLKTLKTIWTTRTAAGMASAVKVDDEGNRYRSHSLIDSRTCAETGFTKVHANSLSNLRDKGLVEVYVTKVSKTYTVYGETYTMFVELAVLTDAGRAAIGV